MALPDFLVIGAPKSGTTALHVALSRHPALWLSQMKEPKHFLCDGKPPDHRGPGDARTSRQAVWDRRQYEALFAAAPAQALRGESTSLYLADSAAHRRIARAIPQARLIALLRDPIDRAHSNWTHLRSAGLEPERDFLRACGLEDQRMADGWAPFWRYLGLGRYGEQLTELFRVFPREQVLVLRYGELRDTPAATLDRICDFLGVARNRIAEVPPENVTARAGESLLDRAAAHSMRVATAVEHRLPETWWRRIDQQLSRRLQRNQRRRTPLDPDQRDDLIPHIIDDVGILEKLTGESFSVWLDPHRPDPQAALTPTRPIGTAHSSIDRPFDSRP